MDLIAQNHKDYDDSNAEGSEEGEILDSEEEYNMRQRIYELEAKNAELEKIARISSDYTNQYNYTQVIPESNCSQSYLHINQRDVGRVPSDASLISSDEFEPIKKHVKRKKRSTYSEFLCKHPSKIKCTHKRRHRPYDNENNRGKVRRTQKECHKKQNKVYLSGTSTLTVPNGYFETISLDSDEEVNQKNTFSNSEDDNPMHLNRDELRFALARDKTDSTKKSKKLLKDRLCNSTFVELKKNSDPTGILDTVSQNFNETEEEILNSHNDDMVSQEEQELRLIALKSAVLKKHFARKKRNAEVAYSPTDFEPVLPQTKSIDNMDVIEEELNELEDVMEISPIVSPKLSLSPLDGEKFKCDSFYQYAGDNNSVDMDIAESESDNEEIIREKGVEAQETWSPIAPAPLSPREPHSSSQYEHPLSVQFGIYVPEMQYFLNTTDDEEPPPPPPFDKNMFAQNDYNLPTNSVFERLGEKTEAKNENGVVDHQFLWHRPEPSSNEAFNISYSDKESDEEASALRAVLLSRFNQKNRQKDINGVKFHHSYISTHEMGSETISNEFGIETVLQKALRRLKSNYNSTYSNAKENKSYDKTELFDDIFNETLESCHEINNKEDELTRTKFDSQENSNSNEDCEKSESPCFADKHLLTYLPTAELEANESAEISANNIPEIDSITHTTEQSRNLSSKTEIAKAASKETLYNAQPEAIFHSTEKKSITHNPQKDEQSFQKVHTLTSARVQPLSVKNTLNQASTIITKPVQAQQLSTPMKKVRRTTKIVRRNKVINREVTTSIKRAAPKAASPLLAKVQTSIENSAKTNVQSLTTIEKAPPKINVKKLIINLRNSETETSDEEFAQEFCLPPQNTVHNVVKQTDDLYNANASPLELVMNSECDMHAYPLKTPALKKDDSQEVVSASSLAFEKKLDHFLKNIRAKETQLSKKHSPIKHPVDENPKILNTPSAVRHLPLSSQDEYRRLLHRMKLLEKQKKVRLSDVDERLQTETRSVKGDVTKDTELNKLSSYEKSFTQTSDNIVALLNQSLSLVAEAKRAKLAKLRHEQRLIELRLEMDKLTSEVRQEELKLNSMKPHLGKSNQFLITLKKKRRELLRSANKLGKTLKGDTYSLVNKFGEEISCKSKKLQAEIKFVNALKADNIEQLLLAQNEKTKATMVQAAGNENQRLPDNASYSKKQRHAKENDETVNENSEQGADDNILQKKSHGISKAKLQVCLDVNDDRITCSEETIPTMHAYVSPLEHLKITYGYLDFNAIVCPYEMWGKCADKYCDYMHITTGRERGTELVKPLKNLL